MTPHLSLGKGAVPILTVYKLLLFREESKQAFLI